MITENNIKVLEKLNIIDRKLLPRTPNEFAATLALAHLQEITEVQIDEWSKSDSWRTKTTEFRGRIFCAMCEQILGLEYCTECGIPLPATLASSIDLLPVPCQTRSFLERTVESLLRVGVNPQEVLDFTQFRNRMRCCPPLDPVDVEMLFDEIGAAELKRRGA